MKRIKILLGLALVTTIFTSCVVDVVHDDYGYIDNTPAITLNQLLGSYELWYVDINQTTGYGETPFLQIAFTMSFRNGTIYANNNLVGIGSQGSGFGISVGFMTHTI